MTSIPPLDSISESSSQKDSPLAVALEILFEPSPILISTLKPKLCDVLKSTSLTSYSHLINLSLQEIAKWDVSAQSEFISGHPRIGKNKNLSTLSAKEQGAHGASPTPPDVLARLSHLNACYEAAYPGLRYITFVNGRSRAAIVEEMENVLGLDHSLSPNEPDLATIPSMDVTDAIWKAELNRAIQDIGLIAKSRLNAIGVQ